MSEKGLANLALVTIATIGPILSASDPATAEKALKLVALAEIDGDPLGRKKYLKEANQTKANFAPASWLRGQVIGADGSWITVDLSHQASSVR